MGGLQVSTSWEEILGQMDEAFSQNLANGLTTCAVHGGLHTIMGCQTLGVLMELADERARQFARYGTNSDLEDGTGPSVSWLRPLHAAPAVTIEVSFREEYLIHEQRTGRPTWTRLIREEVAEAFQEKDPTRLREELLQVAALCVSWVEKIDARPVLGGK